MPAHRLLLETDLAAWAGERPGLGGRRDALLGRVGSLVLSTDGTTIEARVRGNRALPYRVRVSTDGGTLVGRCSCAGGRDSPCRHAVAALEALRFPLRALPASAPERRRSPGRVARGRGRVIQTAPTAPGFVLVGDEPRTPTREERVAAARDEALSVRRMRARQRRARVELFDDGSGPVRFRVADPDEGTSHWVTLRGVNERRGACTCNDYRENELATCCHVERARMWYLRKPKRVPERLLSLWWRPREWPEHVPDLLREIRLDPPPGEGLPSSLGGYFDSAGWLRPAPDGQDAATFARDARESCRRFAAEYGWELDLDPRVDECIRTEKDDAAHGPAREDLHEASAVWQRIRDGLDMRLHPYQEEGALTLARRGRAFLADDMGLGKTVQAIAAALLLRETAGVAKVLVVCPASIKYQWRREIDKACGEQATVVDGPLRGRADAYRRWSDGFLVLNYELVLRDLELIRAAGAELVVLDEAQRIKNWDTKTARAVKQLDSPYAFVLTGTPLENRLLELHSLVEFLHPRALGPRWRLLPFHAVTENEGQVIAYEKLDVLRARLSAFFLRRERQAVLDQLPARTDNTFWTGMTPSQRRPYREQAARLAALLSGGNALTGHEVRVLLRALTNMRVLCNAYAQFAWEDYATRLRDPDPPGYAEIKALHSPKLEEFARVLDDLLEDADHKVVVFSQWARMLRLAEYVTREVLARRDSRAEIFHGGLSARARSEVLEAFRADPEVRVLFSTDAGGLGLNLQESASLVVNLEVPWNPAVLEQRIARVHRMGQRRSVHVLHFVTKGAIEERVRQVVESKRALFDGLLVEQVDRVDFGHGRRDSILERMRALLDSGEL